jgi:sugar/nucleoside kinase (ribokinase family)
MSAPFHVHGIGTIIVDHHVTIPEHPEPDTKCEIVTDRHQVGGPVPTALALLRKFGARTTFQGSWADDPFGEMIAADLEASEIGYHPPASPPGSRSGFAHVWVEQSTGRRTIAAFRGSHPVGEHHLHHEPLDACHALHLDGWSTDAAIAAAHRVRARGARVFIDLGSPKPRLEELLGGVDVLNCPARLVHQLFDHHDLEKGARQLLALGPAEVTVTRGEHGALHASAEGIIRASAYPVDAADTTGAGDVFASAIVFATLQQWPAQQKLRFACAAAALKCRHVGNREALPELREVTELAGL